jgi:hypothetical protein
VRLGYPDQRVRRASTTLSAMPLPGPDKPGGLISSPSSFDELESRVRNFAPMSRRPLDPPYEISNELFASLRHVVHDVGGQPDLPAPFLEKIEEPWEMSTYVTCECLGWRGVWNSEEPAGSSFLNRDQRRPC